jgi:antitoxin component HigA of HigAB toxin-antitoxin module
MSVLKTCPFCGSCDLDYNEGDLSVWCRNCHAEGPNGGNLTKCKIAEAWNCRANDGPHFELPTPAGAIKFRMEQAGHTQQDLAQLIGSRSRASEILSGKRGISKRDIATLCDAWGIPARVLLGVPLPAPPNGVGQ